MIAHNFDEAFSLVRRLVHDFQQNEAQFLAPSYNETAVREVFINRFWMALGWDVTHETQKNPHACEVSVEKNINVEGRGKRADYSFAVAPNYRDVRFFVEAKKPSRQLDNAQDYFQTIRYGWHARTPVAVLMDFEQFRVLDCRYKPDIDVVLQYAALEKFHYTDYADEEKFRRLYHLFSREDVGRGALEEYVAGLPKPGRRGVQGALFARGAYQSIDESFLQDLDTYREQLARAFKQGNPQLDGAQLTEATQRTLDRLVFMRFLEDKLIETDELVERFAGSRAPWAEFVAASRRLDRTYNGIIFKEHPLLDAHGFRVDEHAFAGICQNLSHTRSPYDFNLIPIHILGSIYERFLGKTIVVDADGATVVDKPEVRKAGGVYYTPEYIVRYIVEQTVGRLIAGKTPEQIRPLRFADISCGSGSFLLGVFDLLLSYHAGYYNRNRRTRAEGLKAGCTETDEATLRLSLLQKRTILLNNIYGVDVDAQAVEVAQLSLYLKLLEAETTATTRTHQLAFREALLPSLSRNIISGNSLIEHDLDTSRLFPEEELKINVMSFEQEFPHIMRDGGFDAIVGNPPYIRIQTMQETSPATVDYYKKNYTAAGKGNYDIYVIFVERALRLLNEHGVMGYILPHKFFNAQYGAPLRKFLADGRHLSHIIHFGDQQVFEGATTYTCLLFLNRAATDQLRVVKVGDLNAWRETGIGIEGEVAVASLTEEGEWNFAVGADSPLLSKLNAIPTKLESVTSRIFQGIKTSADKIYIVEEVTRESQRVKIYSRERESEYWLEPDLLHPLIKGGDSKRYYLTRTNRLILFPYARARDSQAALISESILREQYPLTWTYLSDNKSYLENREHGKMRGAKWYGYIYPKALDVMPLPKIFTPDIAPQSAFSLDETGEVFFTGGVAGGYGILVLPDYSRAYVLGLLNSKLLEWFVHQTATSMRGGWYSYEARFIRGLPIRTINFSDAADRARHERMVSLVEGMLAAKRQLAGAGTEAERNLYERKCAAIDAQIDALVYELYALTPQEIALVEAV
ncbi:MAG TPA: Eco57I restriction-modification methylase domain-containing protein [Pyrinomonadaceae bacterium]